MDHLDECRQDVATAAREEREAHQAFLDVRRPLDRDWSPEERAAYRLRLDRWRASSQALVEALDRLVSVQRRLTIRHASRDDSSHAP